MHSGDRLLHALDAMKAILINNWQIKVFFIVIWALMAFLGYSDTADYTHDPSPPWLFYSTLPALLVCFAWANQGEILKRGFTGIEKYVRWAINVIGDALVFGLSLLVPLFLFAMFFPLGTPYSRRSINTALVLEASPLRESITLAADKSGTLVGAGKGVRVPALGHLIDFGYISDDGVIILHSKKTESTLLLISKMENGKTLWQCHGYPEKAFWISCRGANQQWERVELFDKSSEEKPIGLSSEKK